MQHLGGCGERASRAVSAVVWADKVDVGRCTRQERKQYRVLTQGGANGLIGLDEPLATSYTKGWPYHVGGFVDGDSTHKAGW